MEEERFVRKAIYGGRVGPRIKELNEECVYADIKSMYVSVMINNDFPFGAKSWMTKN